jgi:hypothetical protein
MNETLIKEIKTYIKNSITKNENIFQSILDKIELEMTKPARNINELKQRSTKKKGDIFEHFCLLYLQNLGYQAWLIKDTPQEIITLFNLKNFDIGIDIVAKKGDKFYAVQAKYRKLSKSKKYNVLGWKELSTFYALCSRTGNTGTSWEQYIVMTTADHVRKLGLNDEKDLIMKKSTFMDTPKDVWYKMAEVDEVVNEVINEVVNEIPILNKEEVRNKRADYFEKLLKKK